MSPTRLAALVLHTAVRDNLFAAVLDVPIKPVQVAAPARELLPDPVGIADPSSSAEHPAFCIALAGPQRQLTGRIG